MVSVKITVGTVFIAALFVAVYASIKEEQEWDKFVKDTGCTIVATTKSTTNSHYAINGASGNMGTVITTTPATVSWRCEDGVTYTR